MAIELQTVFYKIKKGHLSDRGFRKIKYAIVQDRLLYLLDELSARCIAGYSSNKAMLKAYKITAPPPGAYLFFDPVVDKIFNTEEVSKLMRYSYSNAVTIRAHQGNTPGQ